MKKIIILALVSLFLLPQNVFGSENHKKDNLEQEKIDFYIPSNVDSKIGETIDNSKFMYYGQGLRRFDVIFPEKDLSLGYTRRGEFDADQKEKKYIFASDEYIKNYIKDIVGEERFEKLYDKDGGILEKFTNYFYGTYGDIEIGKIAKYTQTYSLDKEKLEKIEGDTLMLEVPLIDKKKIYGQVIGKGHGKIMFYNPKVIEKSMKINNKVANKKIYRIHKVIYSIDDKTKKETLVFVPYLVFKIEKVPYVELEYEEIIKTYDGPCVVGAKDNCDNHYVI